MKDLVPQKTQKKFNSQHLSGFSLSFSKKYTANIFNEEPVSEDSLGGEKLTTKNTRFNYPSAWNDDEEEYAAQTIDLDERKEDDSERPFFSTQKFKDPISRSRAPK